MKVFFRQEQSCTNSESFSPSAGKPRLVVEDWLSRPEIAKHLEIETFNPATRANLYAAHNPSYVDGVLDCQIKNGFSNKDPAVAESLRYTTGSLLAAAKWVKSDHLEGREARVAVSPTSGFHHAGYAFGGGYCTFNGLIVTAVILKTLGLVDRVLILDFDCHYGNGTDDIIKTLGLDWITNITADKSYYTDDEVLSICHGIKDYAPKRSKATDICIFQAGADIHIDDPLGGLLTTTQMLERDRTVFQHCHKFGLPLVWNLAGGYRRDAAGTIEPVLALHRQTIQACIAEYC
jgi:acetoin utilization deacetylase AcuC-like enzyme